MTRQSLKHWDSGSAGLDLTGKQGNQYCSLDDSANLHSLGVQALAFLGYDDDLSNPPNPFELQLPFRRGFDSERIIGGRHLLLLSCSTVPI